MLELDSLVDGVAAVAYGTPASAAAIRAASEGTAGVRDDGGGLGGGGAGAASFAVGEQLQNMVLVVLGGPWGYGVEAACCPSGGCRHAELCAAKLVRNARDLRASDVGCWAKKLPWFENRAGIPSVLRR